MSDTADDSELALIIEQKLSESSRINSATSKRYWYPLSLATYGKEEVLAAIDSICSFATTMGEKTAAFEQRFAEYQGCEAAVMTNSGSSANLVLAFHLTSRQTPALEPGSEVLMPVLTWPTQVWPIMISGLKVKLVDVSPETLNIDPDDIERSLSARTRAIFLMHAMGYS